MRLLIVVCALLSLACSRYDYTQRGTQPIRVDRWSGQTEALYGSEWRVISPKPVPSTLTAAQQKERAEMSAAFARALDATPDPRCPAGGRFVETSNGPYCLRN